MILRGTAAAWPVPAAWRETGLNTPLRPRKLEHFQQSRGVGRAPGEEGPPARQERASAAGYERCRRLRPSCCFSNEGSARGHRRGPKSVRRQSCSAADIPPSRGMAQMGFKYDFGSGEGRSKRSLGGTAQARYWFGCPTPWHSPRSGLQFGVEAPTAIEWGQGIEAGRAPEGVGAPRVEQAGKPFQKNGLLFGRRPGHIPARGRGRLLLPESSAELPVSSQPSAEGVTSCESPPS